MKKILRFLKRVWILNFIRRIYIASGFFNGKYLQIVKWALSSNEDTNYTYDLTKDNLTELAQMISLVTKKEYSEVLQYFAEVESNKELLEHIIQTTNKSHLKKFADKKVRFGRRLGWYAFARIVKPKVIIETGVDKGLGSVLLCAALEQNEKEGYPGKYFGTDINPEAGYLLAGKYKQYGHILYGDSITSLSDFAEDVDLFINDSDHSEEYEYNEYQTIKPLLKEGSIILGDNSDCTNKLSQFSLENKRHYLFFKEKPLNHWYPGAGIGVSFNVR